MVDAMGPDELTARVEAAAAAGDYLSAARHLRRLAVLQEASLGPSHPELANTLNNLAVAAERAGDLETAEAAFRRASTIARSAFDAGHPFVATSERNLRDFCEAHGRPFEPVPPATPAAPPETPVKPPAVEEPTTVVTRSWSAFVAVGALAGLVAAGVLVWLVDRGSRGAPAGSEDPPQHVASDASAPTPVLPPSPAPAPDAPSRANEPAARASVATVEVVSASVCADFSPTSREWRCRVVGARTSPGPLAFYTRVRVPEPVTLEHRWYRGDSLSQRVTLRVSANTGAGYRTFSRHSIDAGHAGTWRVELRAPDGRVLHEQTFTVD